jgi:2'-5' RNA ligase
MAEAGRAQHRQHARGPRRRLFFALWLGDAERADLAEAAVGPLAGLAGRALAAADWHVTLCFLGAVEERLLAPLCAQAALIAAPPFTLRLVRLDYWHEARVIAALAAEAPAAAQQLASDLRALARSLGLAPDEKPLRPHVTLMRGAEPAAWRPNAAQRRAPLQLTLRATQFHLAESLTLSPAAIGAVSGRYASLARWPLRA